MVTTDEASYSVERRTPLACNDYLHPPVPTNSPDPAQQIITESHFPSKKLLHSNRVIDDKSELKPEAASVIEDEGKVCEAAEILFGFQTD